LRHAATLLLTNRARAIPATASSDAVVNAIADLARDLAALADDTHAPADAAAWLIDEFNRTVNRLPQTFDRESAKRTGAAILRRIGQRAPNIEPRDLFLIYVPEDRLPIAAPLAVELAKRRVSVAFAEYEVASPEDLAAAVHRGLTHHRGGVVLVTPAFERAAHTAPPAAMDRLRILRPPDLVTAVGDLAAWSATLRLSKL
jgi:hypothetical protein